MREHEIEHKTYATAGVDLTRRQLLEMSAVGAFLAACGVIPGTSATTPTGQLMNGFTWYQQSAFRFKGDKTFYIDPVGLAGDLTPADVIFLTHIHGDHFSPDDIKKISTPQTIQVAPKDVAEKLSGNVKTVAPGDKIEVAGIKVQAVPAYNSVQARLQAHPKANNWVGYIFDLPGRTIYHAGDTDNNPELQSIKTDSALVPISGGPFVMDPNEAAALVKAMKPRLAVPIHYGFLKFPAGALGPGAPEVIVGKVGDGETFKTAAGIEVQILNPVNPFKNL
jgi:L-ascorbate metabolism protein UlaG (beta-lactamase superfamily)